MAVVISIIQFGTKPEIWKTITVIIERDKACVALLARESNLSLHTERFI